MAKSLLIFLLILAALPLLSQIPNAINFQGVARSDIGSLLTNSPITIRLSILDNSTAGSVLFTETHSVTTSSNAVFNLKIGQGIVISGNFGNIDWSQGDKFLKIEIDSIGGNNFVHISTTQFMSVPFAYYSKQSGDTKTESKRLKTLIYTN